MFLGEGSWKAALNLELNLRHFYVGWQSEGLECSANGVAGMTWCAAAATIWADQASDTVP